MRAAGLIPPAHIIADGALRRCDVEGGKSGKGDGAFLLHADGVVVGGFQNWRAGTGWTVWTPRDRRDMTPAERRALRDEIARQKAEREAEEARRRTEAAERAAAIWTKAGPAPADHPYLAKKRVGAHGIRQYHGTLVVPVVDIGGNLRSLQFIGADARKTFLTGGAIQGHFHRIGDLGDTVLIAEGYATGATLHEATGRPVLVAFDAGNLTPVASATLAARPGTRIVVCGDDDHKTAGNPGRSKARAAADAVGGIVAVPMFPADRPDKATDWNDLATLSGLDEVRRQLSDVLGGGGGSWQERAMVNSRGATIENVANAALCMREEPALRGLIARDEMARRVMLMRPVPRFQGVPRRAGTYPRPITDEDVTAIQEFLQVLEFPKLNKDTVFSAVDLVATENAYHPVKQYLDGLTWDGVNRLDHWLTDFMGAEASDYTATIGRLFMISMVARIYRPGCKVDFVPIFEGGQGAGKSTACAILGGEWFSDSLPPPGGKDASQHVAGKWFIEIAELSALKKSESEELKAFITRREEKYRPSYGRKEVNEPRQCVFVGTTNKSEYLRDETGARRFWPVKVGVADQIDTEGLKAARDQLFAEAVARFKAGERWWPSREFEAEHIKPQQEQRYEADAWESAIAEFLRTRDRATVLEVARDAVFVETGRLSVGEQRRITGILRRLGWEPKKSGDSRWWQKGGAQ